MYVVEKEMEGRQITQVVLSPLGLSVPIQRCAKPPLQGLGSRPQVPPFPILWDTRCGHRNDQGPFGVSQHGSGVRRNLQLHYWL